MSDVTTNPEIYEQFFNTFQNEKTETKALLEERRTLQQALGATNDELIDEMKKHRIQCIKMDSDSADPDAKPLFVRLYENKKRTRPINIHTIGDCLFGKDAVENTEAQETWDIKVDRAFKQVQQNLTIQKEKETKKKTDEKKRMEKRKRKVRDIKKRKMEEDAKKLKNEENK